MEQILFKQEYRYLWAGAGLLFIAIAGLFLDVMDVDAAQYASIALEMMQNGSWLQVMHRGADYLDKPPLLFWLSAASFEVFGAHNWSYKLPSLLAAIGGVWAVYRFTLLFYDNKTARQAAFILASSLGLLLICNDVRTDTLLLGTTALAIWQLAAYLHTGGWRYLVGGFFFAGLAMLSKGPVGLVMPGFAVGSHLLLSGRWRDIFRWQWIAGLGVTALVLAPMCLGLWEQFDLHPEKIVDGRTGVSGLYFFFWEQSFGRITGENKWKNDTTVLYFLHVYLWAFLPWCLLLPGAWWRSVKDIVRRKTSFLKENYSIGAFTLTFIALSLSRYKLPHYIFVTIPWASVLVAAYLNSISVRKIHWAAVYFLGFIGMILTSLILFFVFPDAGIPVRVAVLALKGLLVWQVVRQPFPADSDALVLRGVLFSFIIGLVMNFHFYPNLLPYQSGRAIAELARSKGIAPDELTYFHRGSHALDFYNGKYLTAYDLHEDIRKRAAEEGAFWVCADEAGKGELEINQIRFIVEGEFPHYPVTLLKGTFLNPKKRDSVLDRIYLLRIEQN